MAALLVRYLASAKAGSVLAVDADPNSSLPETLGLKDSPTMAGIVEEISKSMDKIPAGMTKERFISMKVEDALTEEDKFDLLAMGRPEGPGCYCYVNSLLRDILARMTKSYDFTVIDNAAGMEHISRKNVRMIDKLVLVSDYSAIGVRSVKRIYDLAMELGIKVGETVLVINKVDGPIEKLSAEIKQAGLKVAGEIPYSEELHQASISNKSVFDLKMDPVEDAVKKIFDNLTRG